MTNSATSHVIPESQKSVPVSYQGVTRWFTKSGQLHRVDGPAVERPDIKQWWVHDQLHRTDGPAIERANGSKEWYVNNQRHRTDGPAVVWSGGADEWWVNGRLHRVGGPARRWRSGSPEWWADGRQFTEDEYYRFVDQITGEVLIPPGKKLTHDEK
jgi:hypothetical protein